MYVVWFFEFLFEFATQPLIFAYNVVGSFLDLGVNLGNLIFSFPQWLYIPLSCLLSISILFRVTQFIPLIGGAS
jgi:hypothetical protein